jgi:hypothetical protein
VIRITNMRTLIMNVCSNSSMLSCVVLFCLDFCKVLMCFLGKERPFDGCMPHQRRPDKYIIEFTVIELILNRTEPEISICDS